MGRFSGKAGEEYGLFNFVCPHNEELQNALAREIKKYVEEENQESFEVLEIGSGPGLTTGKILSVDIRISVLAVDNEEVMMSQIKENLPDFIECKRLTLVQEDALNFLKSKQSDSFDIFASAFTLHNFDQKYREQVLREIFRVLKKGGLFANADKYAEDNEVEHNKMLNLQLDRIKKEYSAIGREDLKEEWYTHYLEDNKSDKIMKEGLAIEFMNKIGFKKIKKVYRKELEAVLVAKK